MDRFLPVSAHQAPAAAPTAAPGHRRLTIRGGAFILAGLGLALVLSTHLIAFGTDHLRNQLFDAGSDSSWSHRLVAAVLVAITGCALLGGWRSRQHRGAWAITAAVVAFLSVDEVSALHTQVDRFSWGKALYAPVLAMLALSLWRLSDRAHERVLLRASLAILLVSFTLHVFGTHAVHALGWGSNSWPYEVKVGLKQGTELAGWLLALFGLGGLAMARSLSP